MISVAKIIKASLPLLVFFLFFYCTHKPVSNTTKRSTSAVIDTEKGTEIEKIALANASKPALTDEQRKTLQLGWRK